MTEFIQLLIYGVVLGGIITLGAIGVSLLFGILRFAHFAHGDMMTLGAYSALFFVTGGMPVWGAFPLAILIGIAAAIVIDQLIYKRLRRTAPVILLIASVGVALILRSLIQIVWGADTQVFVQGIQFPLKFGAFRIKPDQLYILLGAVGLVVLLHLFLSYSKLGKAMRAMADDPDLARVTGIDTDRVILWTWGIGATLAVAAGIFLGLDTRLQPTMGWHLLLPVFAAAILGGIGKPYGAIAGGMTVGIATELSTLVIQPSYKPAVAFLLMVIMLVWRPQGLFGGALIVELGGLLSYGVFFLTLVGIYAILALGLNVQWGFTGLFNIGVAAFFAVGAYTTAILTTAQSEWHLGGFGLPLAVGCIGAMLVAALLAFLVGLITLNLREDYLAIASIGIAEIVRLCLKNEEWLTNGVRGISAIPRPFEGVTGDLRDVLFLALVAVLVLLVYLALERGRKSPWGRVLRAIREDETATMAAGKDIVRFRLQAFVLGAAIMGLGGAVYAHSVAFISPEAFDPMYATFLVWVMLIAGGSGNNKGAILGCLIIWVIWSGTEWLLNQLLQQGLMPPEMITQVSALRMLLVGVLLIVILLTRPAGLLPEARTGDGARAKQS